MNRDQIKALYDLGPDAVADLVEHLFSVIALQQAQMASLTARLKELEDRLATDSHNSSKPPSSDSFAKKTKSLRKPSSKKPGGQPGHSGNTLRQVDTPDLVIIHKPSECLSCGSDLDDIAASDMECRQVFDLPPMRLEVTEHRAEIKHCPGCGNSNRAAFPPQVTKAVQYGEGLKALSLYLMNYHLLPYRRSREILQDLFGQSVGEGTFAAAAALCAEELFDSEARIKAGLMESQVGYFDETGMYSDGKRIWLHVASTDSLTHYACHQKRGQEATKEIGILPAFRGRAMHDALKSYLVYECHHALCNAHHLRELTFIEEQLGSEWAGKMKALLIEVKGHVEEAKARGNRELEASLIEEYERGFEEILKEGFEFEASKPRLATGKRGRKKQSKAKNLLDRLSQYRRETLAFMYDFRVGFDNNLAERDLRMMKVQQKISGCFRTNEGARIFCRIRSYISTMRKQGHNVLTVLKSVFAGHPIAPAFSA